MAQVSQINAGFSHHEGFGWFSVLVGIFSETALSPKLPTSPPGHCNGPLCKANQKIDDWGFFWAIIFYFVFDFYGLLGYFI